MFAVLQAQDLETPGKDASNSGARNRSNAGGILSVPGASKHPGVAPISRPSPWRRVHCGSRRLDSIRAQKGPARRQHAADLCDGAQTENILGAVIDHVPAQQHGRRRASSEGQGVHASQHGFGRRRRGRSRPGLRGAASSAVKRQSPVPQATSACRPTPAPRSRIRAPGGQTGGPGLDPPLSGISHLLSASRADHSAFQCASARIGVFIFVLRLIPGAGPARHICSIPMTTAAIIKITVMAVG